MRDVGSSERVKVHDAAIGLGGDPHGFQVDRQHFGRRLVIP
jgi:hypothetical protein